MMTFIGTADFVTGTNDDAVIHIVATRCNSQRQEMKKLFKTLYGRVSELISPFFLFLLVY